jgi:hypothetical protein
MEAEKRNQKIEQWLDAGLKSYADYEPRVGLEGRLLMAVRAERQRQRSWPWLPSLAVAATLFLGSALLLNRAVPVQVHPDAVTSVGPLGRMQRSEMSLHKRNLDRARLLKHHTPLPRSRRASPRAEDPRLDQFPSPQPLTQQEEMLGRYVRERRREAVTVARARAELREHELAHFAEELSAEEGPQNLQP